jgi:uncharacterized membrane protein
MRLGNKFGCHQLEDRSFKILGYQFPICSRCTGILTGQLLGILLIIFGIHFSLLINLLFLSLMFLDWFIQYKGIKKSTNTRRFITGNLAGIAQVSIAFKILILIIGLF